MGKLFNFIENRFELYMLLIFVLGITGTGFLVWVIIKLLRFWGVI